MTKPSSPEFSAFLAPKYWPTWLGIGCLCLIVWLPWRLRMLSGSLLGYLSHLLARERRYITRTNIALCFPELDTKGQEALVRKTFVASGIGLIETATGWVRSAEHFQNQVNFIGLPILQQAKAQGRGVLMLGAHYSTLDFSANLLSLTCPFGATYRAHKNPVFDAFMLRGRLRNCNAVFDRNDIRGAFRHLKKGEVLWYAPDQDYGPKHAVFAPFFGNQAATITTPVRFAAYNGSPVVFVRHHRLEDRKGYELEFTSMDARFPSGDDVLDGTLINQQLEKDIRHYPHQYLWLHKRFKTQPGGKPDSPYIDIRTAHRTLSREQLNNMIAGARVLQEVHSRNRVLELDNGLHLRYFPDLPGKLFPGRHPAVLLDRRSKQLRMNRLACITIDNIFPVPDLSLTAVSYFSLPGISLAKLLEENKQELPVKALAQLFVDLHHHGFFLNRILPDQLIFHENNFGVLNPEQISVRPTSLCYIDRCTNLEQLFTAMT
ncbi:MAG: LpxL/LpxP family Kdo(2)-lipid IV(A) lauroyl/palmitoleoyl acyltransferase, partial [Pseudohongiellaceae bacterium]